MTDANYDRLRATVRAALEDASGQAITVLDATTDELITTAEAEGVPWSLLFLWIFTGTKPDGWSARAFARWLERYRALGTWLEGEGGRTNYHFPTPLLFLRRIPDGRRDTTQTRMRHPRHDRGTDRRSQRMSEQIETETIDKSTWGEGPWQDEPDRAQWQHAGFACLAVRHPDHGNFCGYVGVPRVHPAYAKHYDVVSDADVDLAVHGGLTYSGKCQGRICHVPEEGMPADVWWLGFDCAHCWDLAPGLRARMREIMPASHFERFPEADRDEVYRTLDYVREQADRLADQLAEMDTLRWEIRMRAHAVLQWLRQMPQRINKAKERIHHLATALLHQHDVRDALAQSELLKPEKGKPN
jgi:hypothetical protein